MEKNFLGKKKQLEKNPMDACNIDDTQALLLMQITRAYRNRDLYKNIEGDSNSQSVRHIVINCMQSTGELYLVSMPR